MSTDYSLSEPLVVELMNTVNFGVGGTDDELEGVAGVVAWLRTVGDRISAEAGRPVDGPDQLDAVQARRFRDLRDAVRKLAADVTDDPRPATAPELTRQRAINTVNELARAWPELVWPDDGRPARSFRTSRTSSDLAVSLIAHQAVELFAGPGRERLRACLAPGCLLFFFKRSTRREWCSPACGNRARVARHYVRHQAVRTH
ncbi:ABATE domain-containing protein [Kribbella sp. NPDC000426]|uniref:CGNR zinc finger domain-containing protein n=1 Tax=Kribbella sp. NPDC000426 TaxID=3154255 RepID=UPI00331A1579